MIKLEGLTRHQVEICDMLWECDTTEEVKFLLDVVLSEEDRLTALTLIEMIHMEAAERDGGLERVKPQVNRMLARIMRESKRC